MSETPRRYSAEEIELIAEKAQANWPDFFNSSHIVPMLFQAAEDASRLEQIEKWVSVQMSEGELRGYLPDLRDLLSSSAGRREETEGTVDDVRVFDRVLSDAEILEQHRMTMTTETQRRIDHLKTAPQCIETGHDYCVADEGYYKPLVEGGPYDQTVTYARLFCKKCGETKEIVVRN